MTRKWCWLIITNITGFTFLKMVVLDAIFHSLGTVGEENKRLIKLCKRKWEWRTSISSNTAWTTIRTTCCTISLLKNFLWGECNSSRWQTFTCRKASWQRLTATNIHCKHRGKTLVKSSAFSWESFVRLPSSPFKHPIHKDW